MLIFKYIFKYWKKNLPLAIFCQLIGYVAIFLGLYIPLFGQVFIDYVIAYKGQPVSTNPLLMFLLDGSYGALGSYELFISIAITFIIFTVVRVALLYIRNNLYVYNGMKLENELRRRTYEKLLSLSSSTVLNYNTGDLLNTLNMDMVSVKDLYSVNLLNIGDVLFKLVAASILLIGIHPLFMIIPIILAPLLFFFLRRFISHARRISGTIRNANADINMTVQENINAVRIVHSYSNEKHEIEKFDVRNNNFKRAYLKHTDITSGYGVIFNILRQLAYISSIAIGAILVFRGQLFIGSLVACSGYTIIFMELITHLNMHLFNMQQQLVSAGRIMNLLETDVLIKNPVNPEPMEDRTDIVLRDVSIKLNDNEILKNINIDIPQGKKIGVMGMTGSGKTILLKSLSRIYDVDTGSIMINGIDIKNYDLEAVRGKFSFVFQDVFLFSNTIDANIAFARPEASQDDVVRAAKISQAHNFVSKMQQGYSTIIGEKGLGLSGGQKQRISIARAILKNAPVLILDDATSSLDVFTERALLRSLKEEYSDKTIIISAHRASAVADCDEIIFLAHGEIVERGTFDELIALDGYYANIYNKQSSYGSEIADSSPIELDRFTKVDTEVIT